ncbi:MAG: CGCGG family rSAM-modified RiPP protein [Halobacteriales archaeon]|nr:CGCGG family rSAM-modified RiPP protein [Halobacteriales archaeon]
MAAHDHADADPVTDRVHENSWSANLEGPRHADDRERVLADATAAIEHTAAGYHVNLVTHAEQGHPEGYLYPHLEAADVDADLEWEYVDQCGCGGHVTRVHVG